MKCRKCGYKAVKLESMVDCPMCKICKCGNTIMQCTCKEN